MIDHGPMQADSWEGYRLVVASLPRRELAVDVGSNTGGIAERLGKDFDWVDCFEPLLDLMPPERLSYPDNASVIDLGLSDNPSIQKVRVKNAWTLVGEESAVVADDAAEFRERIVDVEFVCLDSMVADVDFIKLDVDGFEGKVLTGASSVLIKSRPPVMMELSNLAKLIGDEPTRAARILFDMNYRCVSMDGEFTVDSLEKLMPYWPHHTSYDVLFIPNEITLATQ